MGDNWNMENLIVLTPVSYTHLPQYEEENIEEYVSLPTAIFGKGDFFILRASGQSMLSLIHIYIKSTPYLMSFMRDYQLKRYLEKYFKERPEIGRAHV